MLLFVRMIPIADSITYHGHITLSHAALASPLLSIRAGLNQPLDMTRPDIQRSRTVSRRILQAVIPDDLAKQAYIAHELKQSAAVFTSCSEHAASPSHPVKSATDLDFLVQAKEQLQKVQYRPGSQAAYARDVILQHLATVRSPSPKLEIVGTSSSSVEAYFLDSSKARQLLESSSVIEAPVFTHASASFKWKSYSQDQLPIEQLFDWFPVSSEKHS